MRTLLILLSIGLFLTLIQYSNGAPRRPVQLESDEDDSVEMKPAAGLTPNMANIDESDESDEIKPKSKPVPIQIDDDSQSSEEIKKPDDAVKLTFRTQKSNDHSDEHDNDDDDNDDEN